MFHESTALQRHLTKKCGKRLHELTAATVRLRRAITLNISGFSVHAALNNEV